MNSAATARVRGPASVLAALLVASCAARTARTARPASPAPPPPDRGFAEVVKGATSQPGFFTVWRRRERAWLELRPDQLERPFLFAVDRTRGMGQGEPRLSGNTTGTYNVALFRRLGNQVQLIAVNGDYTARPGTPEARAVRESFSDSLLASAPVLGTPHPQRKSILIDANALLLADIPSAVFDLELTFRQPYAFDAAASSLGVVASSAAETIVDVSAHYRLARIPIPPPGSLPLALPPVSLTDYRSLFLGYAYRFVPLPPPYHPRRADDRVGHFTTTLWDYSDDHQPDPRVHYVARWRLEKADPAAPLSRPRRPIVYWIDANVPEAFRTTVKEGVLAWNRAFERLGFKDALEVRQAAAGAAPDHAALPSAWIRWFMTVGRGSSYGSMMQDPRTGEILHAHVSVSDLWSRAARARFVDEETPTAQAGADDPNACGYAMGARRQLDFALDLLEARAEAVAPAGTQRAPDDPEVDALVKAQLKEMVMHEVGHTLGLRHNFRASAAYNLADLGRRDFTRDHGIASSVMDYNAPNLAARGEPQADYFMSTIGPYDEWAIEYAYRPLEAQDEAAELARIAARASEPGLTYGDDADAGTEEELGLGVDPEVNRWDLGADVLGFSRRRLALTRELWDRLATRQLSPGEDTETLRRAFDRGFGQLVLAARTASKYVGGVSHVYDHGGSARAPLTPVPAARQREAMALLRGGVFAESSFQLPAALLNRLAPSRLAGFGFDPLYPLYDRVTRLQGGVLEHLLSPNVARRLLDLESRYAAPGDAFTMAELHQGLRASVWSELGTGGDIPPLRRSLQSAHLGQLLRQVLHPLPGTPADARALCRADLRALQPLLRARLRRPTAPATRAHLEEALSEVDEALRASLQMTAP
jgi:hypothetical protein